MAIAASILALIASPSNLIGLAIGIWSLVVLCRPAIGMAFERTKRTKSARPAVTGFQWTMGLAALAAILISMLAMYVGDDVRAMPPVFISIDLIALVLGIIGWRSLVGKAAAIVSAGVLLFVLGAVRIRSDDRNVP